MGQGRNQTFLMTAAVGVGAALLSEFLDQLPSPWDVDEVVIGFFSSLAFWYRIRWMQDRVTRDRQLNHDIRNAMQVLAYSDNPKHKEECIGRVEKALKQYTETRRKWH
jgi:hypothetical protein